MKVHKVSPASPACCFAGTTNNSASASYTISNSSTIVSSVSKAAAAVSSYRVNSIGPNIKEQQRVTTSPVAYLFAASSNQSVSSTGLLTATNNTGSYCATNRTGRKTARLNSESLFVARHHQIAAPTRQQQQQQQLISSNQLNNNSNNEPDTSCYSSCASTESLQRQRTRQAAHDNTSWQHYQQQQHQMSQVKQCNIYNAMKPASTTTTTMTNNNKQTTLPVVSSNKCLSPAVVISQHQNGRPVAAGSITILKRGARPPSSFQMSSQAASVSNKQAHQQQQANENCRLTGADSNSNSNLNEQQQADNKCLQLQNVNHHQGAQIRLVCTDKLDDSLRELLLNSSSNNDNCLISDDQLRQLISLATIVQGNNSNNSVNHYNNYDFDETNKQQITTTSCSKHLALSTNPSVRLIRLPLPPVVTSNSNNNNNNNKQQMSNQSHTCCRMRSNRITPPHNAMLHNCCNPDNTLPSTPTMSTMSTMSNCNNIPTTLASGPLADTPQTRQVMDRSSASAVKANMASTVSENDTASNNSSNNKLLQQDETASLPVTRFDGSTNGCLIAAPLAVNQQQEQCVHLVNSGGANLTDNTVNSDFNCGELHKHTGLHNKNYDCDMIIGSSSSSSSETTLPIAAAVADTRGGCSSAQEPIDGLSAVSSVDGSSFALESELPVKISEQQLLVQVNRALLSTEVHLHQQQDQSEEIVKRDCLVEELVAVEKWQQDDDKTQKQQATNIIIHDRTRLATDKLCAPLFNICDNINNNSGSSDSLDSSDSSEERNSSKHLYSPSRHDDDDKASHDDDDDDRATKIEPNESNSNSNNETRATTTESRAKTKAAETDKIATTETIQLEHTATNCTNCTGDNNNQTRVTKLLARESGATSTTAATAARTNNTTSALMVSPSQLLSLAVTGTAAPSQFSDSVSSTDNKGRADARLIEPPTAQSRSHTTKALVPTTTNNSYSLDTSTSSLHGQQSNTTTTTTTSKVRGDVRVDNSSRSAAAASDSRCCNCATASKQVSSGKSDNKGDTLAICTGNKQITTTTGDNNKVEQRIIKNKQQLLQNFNHNQHSNTQNQTTVSRQQQTIAETKQRLGLESATTAIEVQLDSCCCSSQQKKTTLVTQLALVPEVPELEEPEEEEEQQEMEQQQQARTGASKRPDTTNNTGHKHQLRPAPGSKASTARNTQEPAAKQVGQSAQQRPRHQQVGEGTEKKLPNCADSTTSANLPNRKRPDLSFSDALEKSPSSSDYSRKNKRIQVAPTELSTATTTTTTTGQTKITTYTMANAQTTNSKSYTESSLKSQQPRSSDSVVAGAATLQSPSSTQQSDTICNIKGNIKKQQQQQQGDQTVESNSVKDQSLNSEQRHRQKQNNLTGTTTETTTNANTNTTIALADYIIVTQGVEVTALEIENKKDDVKNKTVDCAKAVAHHSSSAAAAGAAAAAVKVEAKAAVAANTDSLLPSDIRNLQFKSVQVESRTQTKSTTITTADTVAADTLTTTTSTASSNAVLNPTSINSSICTNSSLVTSTSLATKSNNSNSNTTTATTTTNTMSTATGNGNTLAIETTSATDHTTNIDKNSTSKSNTINKIDNIINNNNKQYNASNGPPSNISQESGHQQNIEPQLKDSINNIESNPTNMSGNTKKESGRQDNNEESTPQNDSEDTTQETEVKPSSQNMNTRCILLLREIEEETSVEEVEGIFKRDGCPSFPIQCKYAHNFSWYITFKTDSDAKLAMLYIRENVGKFKGRPIMARIKTKTSNITAAPSVPTVSAPNHSNANVVLTSIVPSTVAHTSTTSALYSPPENIKNLNGVLTNSYVQQPSREHLQVMSTISTSDQAFLNKHQDPSMTLNGTNYVGPTHHPSHYGHSQATYYGPGPVLAPWTPQPSAPFYDLSDVFIYNGLAPHPSSIKSLNGGHTGNSAAVANQGSRAFNHGHNNHAQQQQVNPMVVNGSNNTRNLPSTSIGNPSQRQSSNRHHSGRHHPTVTNLQPVPASASTADQRLGNVMITGPKVVRASVGSHHATSSLTAPTNSTMPNSPNQDNQSTKTTHNQHPMSRMVSDNSSPGDSHTSDSTQDTSMRASYNSTGRRSEFSVTGRNNARSHNRSQLKESNSNSIDKPNDIKQNILSPGIKNSSNDTTGSESSLNCNLSKASSSTTNSNIDVKDKNNNSRKQANSQVTPNQQQDNQLSFRAKSSGGDHPASRSTSINQYHPSSSTTNSTTVTPSYLSHGGVTQSGHYGLHSSYQHNTKARDRPPHKHHHMQNQHLGAHHQQLKKAAPFDLESSAFPPLPLVQDLVGPKFGEPSTTNPLVTTASIVRSSHTSDTESLVK